MLSAMTINYHYLLVGLGCMSRATDNFESFEFDMEFIENVSLFPIHVNYIQSCDGKTFVKTPEVIWSELIATKNRTTCVDFSHPTDDGSYFLQRKEPRMIRRPFISRLLASFWTTAKLHSATTAYTTSVVPLRSNLLAIRHDPAKPAKKYFLHSSLNSQLHLLKFNKVLC